jgi:hypothetical protein
MASTYSSLKIELITTGEQSGTWGATTNTNLGTAIEEAIVGYATANFTSDANLTISLTNTNATQVARNLVLNLTSDVSLTATRNLIVPTIEKPYYIFNNTTGGQSILVKTTAGTGITVPNGSKMFVYTDGTNVVEAVNRVGSLTLGTALPVASGGTGQTSYTNGQLLIGNSTGNTLTKTTLTAGTNVTITNGPGSITIDASGGGSGGITYTRVTSTTTLTDKQGVIADTTSGSFTVNLPATPSTGAQVFIADGGNWATNNLTVGRNGSTIENTAADYTLNQGGAQAQFVYDGTTWQLYTQYGPEFNGTLKSYKETVVTVSASTATTNLDLRQGNIFNVSISSNTTFTFTNPPASGLLQSATVIIKQDATGGRTGSFTNSKWTDSIAPTLTTTANKTDVFTFFTIDGGTSYFGTYALANVT